MKKRRNDGKAHRPNKKQRMIQAYNSDSEQEFQKFDPVDLLDSDDDIHNAKVDDVAGDDENHSSSSEEEAETLKKQKKGKSKKVNAKTQQDANDDSDEEESESDAGSDNMDGEAMLKKRAKRNDPSAFANSISKILATKLSTSKRSDPVLSRSSAAHYAAKAAVDNALESKARRKLKEQKRVALEKGRVKDVLLATQTESNDEPEVTTAEVLEMEKKLRKVAQRGVVKLFNAVRSAQVKSAEAERGVKKEGVIGMKNREEKVNEMTKKGFLELIASGGGNLKKGPLEEA